MDKWWDTLDACLVKAGANLVEHLGQVSLVKPHLLKHWTERVEFSLTPWHPSNLIHQPALVL